MLIVFINKSNKKTVSPEEMFSPYGSSVRSPDVSLMCFNICIFTECYKQCCKTYILYIFSIYRVRIV